MTKMKEKKLFLDLDGLAQDGYFYTRYDIGGDSHSITIKAKNKNASIKGEFKN